MQGFGFLSGYKTKQEAENEAKMSNIQDYLNSIKLSSQQLVVAGEAQKSNLTPEQIAAGVRPPDAPTIKKAQAAPGDLERSVASGDNGQKATMKGAMKYGLWFVVAFIAGMIFFKRK